MVQCRTSLYFTANKYTPSLVLLFYSFGIVVAGIGNLMACVSSGYPVAGANGPLSAASGSRTTMSKAFTVAIIVITLAFFAEYLYYVPNAALTAIVWTSMYNLVNFSDIWS